MIKERIFLGLIIGLVSYCTLYFGKGIQKYAVEGIKSAKTIKTKHSGIWIIGTILTALPVFFQWAALLFAPINLIAPLEGIGLIILLLYSSRKLKESISGIELAAIGAVIVGIFFTAFFHTPNPVAADIGGSAAHSSGVAVNRILFVLAPFAAVETALVLIAIKRGFKSVGYIIGFTAGTAMAFQTVAKRISIFEGFTIYGIIGALVFAPLTLFITQVGFTKAKANRVVPSFTAASIIVATASGVLILNEQLQLMQIVGIILVAVGAVMMTAGGKRNDQLEQNGVNTNGGDL